MPARVIAAFGATFDELSTNAWTAIPDGALVYAVDRHGRYAHRIPNARPVIADTAQVVRAIRRSAPREPALAGVRKQIRPVPLVQGTGDGPVHPSALMRWLSRTLPPDVVVHADAGNSLSWSTRDLVRRRPDTYRVAMGLSTMRSRRSSAGPA